MDYLAAMICDRVFERFSNLRMASIENGSGYLSGLFARLRGLDRKLPGYFAQDPVETFRRHIWISPFWEERIEDVIELVGPDRVLFGSDWPHVEGLPQPLQYLDEIDTLDEGVRRRLVHDNAHAPQHTAPGVSDQPSMTDAPSSVGHRALSGWVRSLRIPRIRPRPSHSNSGPKPALSRWPTPVAPAAWVPWTAWRSSVVTAGPTTRRHAGWPSACGSFRGGSTIPPSAAVNRSSSCTTCATASPPVTSISALSSAEKRSIPSM